MQDIDVTKQLVLQSVTKRLDAEMCAETSGTSKRLFGGELWLELEQGSV